MADRERRRLIFAHQEWLGFVQPVGLVVSPPVMVDAQVVPDRNVSGRQREFTALLERDDTGATTHWRAPDIRRVFLDWLGWDETDLAGVDADRERLEIALPELQAVLAPTWAVPVDGGADGSTGAGVGGSEHGGADGCMGAGVGGSEHGGADGCMGAGVGGSEHGGADGCMGAGVWVAASTAAREAARAPTRMVAGGHRRGRRRGRRRRPRHRRWRRTATRTPARTTARQPAGRCSSAWSPTARTSTPRPRDAAWNASRHERFVRLLSETGVPAGLLCTDDRIRLIYAPGGETPGYLTFDFSQMAMPAGRPILAAFDMLLSAHAMFVNEEQARLPALLARSREAQAEVSTKLARQVLAALYELLRGFVAADARHGALPALARDSPATSTAG